jgi:hypothetical protein
MQHSPINNSTTVSQKQNLCASVLLCYDKTWHRKHLAGITRSKKFLKCMKIPKWCFPSCLQNSVTLSLWEFLLTSLLHIFQFIYGKLLIWATCFLSYHQNILYYSCNFIHTHSINGLEEKEYIENFDEGIILLHVWGFLGCGISTVTTMQ